ncbi:MAG TPA: acetate--CoA ligase [Candidatus Polarisedimenticolia bacterium]|nr:acetate--CoA ligase [Candidatus Polarisedimenticolia bacterium]
MSVEPQSAPAIENLLSENRTFPPSAEFAAQANARASLYEEAERDFVGFWERQARERISWDTPFTTGLEWDLPFAKWFGGGTLNITYNCVDRHVERGLGDKIAYHWVGEPGDIRTLTYADLMRESSKAANALKALGVRTGDRVAIYLPMIPELPIAMLACARIGAPHTVVFGGFSAEALSDRINDCGAKLIITADGGWRRGKEVLLKPAADAAAAAAPSIENILVVSRLGAGEPHAGTAMTAGRDHWWHELVDGQSETCPPVPVDSEHMLYLLYTSGTTAKPKGILHTTAGYLVGTSFTHEMIFDIKPDDVYWCAADIGWVTGHSYIVYGPLANATTGVIYEGAPDTPGWDRFWQIVEDYKVTILYTAPTAIRAFMKQGPEFPAKHDLSSLRLLGSVGEPINPEAWLWYQQVIGAGRTPVVDTWWQTETGMILITPLPGVTTTKPGSATFPFPGISADVVDTDGNSVPFGGGGYLVLKRPWPAMLRGIYGDPERFKQTYWSRFPGMYFAGDGAKRDEEGYFWLLGRVDDVMNVAGHRMSTTEIESALVSHPSVAESAVVGKNDELTGQAVFAFVILKAGQEPSDELAKTLREHVSKMISPIARPKFLLFVPDLPKTRSGKIMRRLLRDIAEGRNLGDTTTLADTGVVETIRDNTGRAED